jgi:hypothetical protein
MTLNDHPSSSDRTPDANSDAPNQGSTTGEGSSDTAHDALPEQPLEELIAELESDPAPRDENDFERPFDVIARGMRERGDAIPVELMAEVIAFQIHACDHGQQSTWGIYFGPMMSGLSAGGEPWDVPALTLVNSEVINYWTHRAHRSRHPVMRARYADLLWELPRQLKDAKRDAEMARIAVDSYLEAVEAHRYSHPVSAIAKSRRALEVALSLNDSLRVERARDVLLALEDSVAEDSSAGLWGFCFDAFIEPPNKRVPVSDAQRQPVVAAMESRLARFAAGPPDEFHPAGPEAAALRLANYYRRLRLPDDVARVLRMYRDIVLRMRGTAAPMVVGHSLEHLYDLLITYGLHKDADALNAPMREVGEQTLSEMKTISTEGEISREDYEAFFAEMLVGSGHEVLHRIAIHFIPDRQAAETELKELAKTAPFSYLLSRIIKDDDGRTIARIGPLETDLEGQLLHHVSQHLYISTVWLREAMARGFESELLSRAVLLEFLLLGALFRPDREVILEAGLKAYEAGDSIAAIHILIPQVEQALRRLAMLLGAPIYTQRRGGGLHARTLDDLLRDDDISAVLGDSLTTYFRVLLTDSRAWNIRNNVCHGLATASRLGMHVADRVVHALLVLGLFREKQGSPEPAVDA